MLDVALNSARRGPAPGVAVVAAVPARMRPLTRADAEYEYACRRSAAIREVVLDILGDTPTSYARTLAAKDEHHAARFPNGKIIAYMMTPLEHGQTPKLQLDSFSMLLADWRRRLELLPPEDTRQQRLRHAHDTVLRSLLWRHWETGLGVIQRWRIEYGPEEFVAATALPRRGGKEFFPYSQSNLNARIATNSPVTFTELSRVAWQLWGVAQRPDESSLQPDRRLEWAARWCESELVLRRAWPESLARFRLLIESLGVKFEASELQRAEAGDSTLGGARSLPRFSPSVACRLSRGELVPWEDFHPRIAAWSMRPDVTTAMRRELAALGDGWRIEHDAACAEAVGTEVALRLRSRFGGYPQFTAALFAGEERDPDAARAVLEYGAARSFLGFGAIAVVCAENPEQAAQWISRKRAELYFSHVRREAGAPGAVQLDRELWAVSDAQVAGHPLLSQVEPGILCSLQPEDSVRVRHQGSLIALSTLQVRGIIENIGLETVRTALGGATQPACGMREILASYWPGVTAQRIISPQALFTSDTPEAAHRAAVLGSLLPPAESPEAATFVRAQFDTPRPPAPDAAAIEACAPSPETCTTKRATSHEPIRPTTVPDARADKSEVEAAPALEISPPAAPTPAAALPPVQTALRAHRRAPDPQFLPAQLVPGELARTMLIALVEPEALQSGAPQISASIAGELLSFPETQRVLTRLKTSGAFLLDTPVRSRFFGAMFLERTLLARPPALDTEQLPQLLRILAAASPAFRIAPADRQRLTQILAALEVNPRPDEVLSTAVLLRKQPNRPFRTSYLELFGTGAAALAARM